jgi:hypothetical protein
MTDKTKQGIWSRLFGGNKSCCNLKIEEVAEEQPKAPDNQNQTLIEPATEEQSQIFDNEK